MIDMNVEQQQPFSSETVTIREPIEVLSLEKKGAYSETGENLWKPLLEASGKNVSDIRTFGLYLDNPSRVPADQCRSIGMVVVDNADDIVNSSSDEDFKKLIIDAGDYLVFTVTPETGDTDCVKAFSKIFVYAYTDLSDKVYLYEDAFEENIVNSVFVENVVIDKENPQNNVFKVYFKIKK